MRSHQAELAVAHVHAMRAFGEWSRLKEHIAKHFANVQMSKMWEALALPRDRAQ